MTYLPKAAVGPAETFAASFFFGATPLAHKLSHFLSESEISSLVSGVISAALPHLGEPNCWRIDETVQGGAICWRTVEHRYHAFQIAAESVHPVSVYPLYRAPQAPAVAVKPLEWEECDWHWQRGKSPITKPSNYLVRPCLADRWVGQWMLYAPGGSGDERLRIGGFYPTVDAAKAAAEADYERRIRSVLVDAPALAEAVKPAADPVKAQLVEALRPFAIFAEHHPGSATYRSFLQLLVCPEGDDHPRNYGPHFQRARAALEAYEKESSNAPA